MEEFLKFFIPLAVIAGFVCWISLRRSQGSRGKMAVDRPDQVYSAFTKQFDLKLPADGNQAALAGAKVRTDITSSIEIREPEARFAGAQLSYEAASASGAADALRNTLADLEPGSSVCLLIDQSGSMADSMVVLAGQLKVASELAAVSGINLAIFGFTTVGWHGGQSRQAWLNSGSPPYPGRLCALMHIVFQEFGEQFSDKHWQAMLQPNIFFENVDGEAIQWATTRLKEQSSKTKILIVVSDGAPVDDATLLANGPEILDRHLRKVIQETEGNPDIRLGAIGIGYDVASHYAHAKKAEGPGAFLGCLNNLVARLATNKA